jgi:carbonic anhydrase
MQTEMTLTHSTENSSTFVSPTRWVDDEPDCLVISCSDHRFEEQTRELAHHLGFARPHTIQMPSGPALALTLVASLGFLSKAMDKIVEKAVEMKQATAKEIICIGHQDCGGYKGIGKVPLLSFAARRLTGRSVHDLQREHLAKVARQIARSTGMPVRAFFADVVDGADGKRVRFTEVK